MIHSRSLNFFLLAAGEGTRFRPHTLVYPKPSIPFLNIPLAYYSLAFAESIFACQQVQSVVVNTFHLPHFIKKLFPKGQLPKEILQTFSKNNVNPFEVQFSDEHCHIRDSGGGLAFAKAKFKAGSIVCMNLDEVILPHDNRSLNQAIESHFTENHFATLITMKHPEAGKKFGAIWVDSEFNVIGIGKNKPVSSKQLEPLHYLGVQILEQEIFNYLGDGEQKKNIFYDGVFHALNDGHKIKAAVIDCAWFETGNEQDYIMGSLECIDILKNSDHPSHSYLKSVVENYSSFAQELFEGRVLKPKNMILKSEQIIEKAVLGLGLTIKPSQSIKNSILCTSSDKLIVENKFVL